MPTDRVHCPSEQVKVWSVCAEVTVLHRGEGCLAQGGGLPRTGGRAASHRGEGCLALYPQSLVRVAGYPQGLIALMISTRGAARIHI